MATAPRLDAKAALRIAASLVRRQLGFLRQPVVEVRPGVRMLTDLGTARGLLLYRYGLHEPELELLERVLAPGDTFVDGGAHIGQFALPAAVRVGSSGRVIAFEPNGATADALAKNARVAGVTLELRRTALGSAPGRTPFTSYAGDAAALSSFVAPEPGGVVAEVEVETLDDVLAGAPLRLLKLDVEGAELAALQGAARTLSRWRPDLLLEVVPENLARGGTTPLELEEFLRPLGYSFSCVVDDGVVPVAELAAPLPGPNVFASCG